VAVFPPHVHTAAWGIAVALAALAGLAASASRDARNSWKLPPAGWWIVLLLTGAIAINVTFAAQRLQAARTVAMWCAYLCMFLYCAGLRRGPDDGEPAVRRVLGALAIVATALAVHGLYQSLYEFERLAEVASSLGLPEAVRARLGSTRAVATLGLPDALSGLLAISVPVTVWLARANERGWLRRLLWVMTFIQGACLVATRSAGGFASLALAGAAVLWWRGRTARGAARRRLAIVLVTTGLSGAALLLAARLLGPGASGDGNPLALRLGNWSVAASMARDHLLFGTGAGCFGVSFPAYREWGMNETQFVHNSFLQLFSETGLFLGGAALAGAVALGLTMLGSGVAPLLAVACVSFLIHNAADFTFYVPTVGFTFFCLAGLVVGPRDGRLGAREAPVARSGGAAVAGRGVAALCLASFALIVTRADMKRDAARDAVVAGEHSLAAALAREAIAGDPFDPEARSLLSRLEFEQSVATHDPGRLVEAEAQARRAVEIDPHTPNHWHHLGRVLLARGDPQGAYIALSRAAELYPIKIEYRKDRDAVLGALAGAAPKEPAP